MLQEASARLRVGCPSKKIIQPRPTKENEQALDNPWMEETSTGRWEDTGDRARRRAKQELCSVPNEDVRLPTCSTSFKSKGDDSSEDAEKEEKVDRQVIEVTIGKFVVRLFANDGEDMLRLHAASPSGVTTNLQLNLKHLVSFFRVFLDTQKKISNQTFN